MAIGAPIFEKYTHSWLLRDPVPKKLDTFYGFLFLFIFIWTIYFKIGTLNTKSLMVPFSGHRIVNVFRFSTIYIVKHPKKKNRKFPEKNKIKNFSRNIAARKLLFTGYNAPSMLRILAKNQTPRSPGPQMAARSIWYVKNGPKKFKKTFRNWAILSATGVRSL